MAVGPLRCQVLPLTYFYFNFDWRFTMKIRTTLAITMTTLALLATTGCAVQRGQETVGAYVDDAGITTLVKTRFIENKTVDASAISVETLKGTVMLSGFAKSQSEKGIAEGIARGVKGVVGVQNNISVRP
jgi:hyperosmotically inducible periplasmic protein